MLVFEYMDLDLKKVGSHLDCITRFVDLDASTWTRKATEAP